MDGDTVAVATTDALPDTLGLPAADTLAERDTVAVAVEAALTLADRDTDCDAEADEEAVWVRAALTLLDADPLAAVEPVDVRVTVEDDVAAPLPL